MNLNQYAILPKSITISYSTGYIDYQLKLNWREVHLE